MEYLILLAVIGFVVWKFKDKILALADKFKKPESGTNVPNPGTTPVVTPPVSPPVETPVNPETGLPRIIDKKPTNQAEWDEYRNSFVPSTRAFIPEKFDPTVIDSGTVDTTARGLPTQWDNAAWRGVVQFRKDSGQSIAFVYKAPFRLHLDPAAGDRRNARYSVTLAERGNPAVEILAGSFGTAQIKGLTVGSQYELGITSNADSQSWVILG